MQEIGLPGAHGRIMLFQIPVKRKVSSTAFLVFGYQSFVYLFGLAGMIFFFSYR